jgi:pyruvate/2-oxoglutarate dehydrogenase complex dihydrolipoamide dehydrogenase (E3) component
MEGRGEEVRPCLRCLNCTDGDNLHRHFSCTVNPLTGHEQRLGFGDEPIAPAPFKKTVLVVGGGPAGMSAAVTAAQRGHRVILCEKGEKLGGTINFADRDSLKIDLRRYKAWLIRQTEKAAVEIRLNTEVTPDQVRVLEPDHIIVAAGAETVTPKIPGVGLARHALEAYGDPKSVGDRVAVIGGGLVGVECGMQLCNTGHGVTVLEALDEAARDACPVYKIGMTAKAEELGLDIRTGAKVLEITAAGVRYEKDGKETFLPADTVLYAVGMRSRIETYLALAPLAPHVDLIGDCKAPGKLLGAIHGGYFAAIDVGRS